MYGTFSMAVDSSWAVLRKSFQLPVDEETVLESENLPFEETGRFFI